MPPQCGGFFCLPVETGGLCVSVSAAARSTQAERQCGDAVPDVSGWRSFDTRLGIVLLIAGLSGFL